MSPRRTSPRTDPDVDVEAAGCLVVRAGDEGPEVLLVHRPTTATRTADWSWPKGKLDRTEDGTREHPAVAAVRETLEETGVPVHLGVPLPERRYEVPDKTTGAPLRKRVRYWVARPTAVAELEAAGPEDAGEITETAWVSPARARELLSYAHDVELLDVALPHGALPEPTWPLVVLRHARAVKRTDWKGEEATRPLLDAGHAQSRDLAPLLACFDVRALVTSPWARCVQTVLPAAELTGLPVEEDAALTEAAFDEEPKAPADVITELLGTGRAVVVCSHGPVLPTLLAVVVDHAPAELTAPVGAKLDKGALVVAHVVGRGTTARVVAVEHHAF